MKYYVTRQIQINEEVEIEADSKEQAEEKARDYYGDVVNEYDPIVLNVMEIQEES